MGEDDYDNLGDIALQIFNEEVVDNISDDDINWQVNPDEVIVSEPVSGPNDDIIEAITDVKSKLDILLSMFSNESGNLANFDYAKAILSSALSGIACDLDSNIVQLNSMINTVQAANSKGGTEVIVSIPLN